RLIEKGLLTSAKKSGAAGTLRADVAGRRKAASIKKALGRSGDIQKNLLTETLGPDGLIALEAIAVERIVPAVFGIDVLAPLRVAAVIGLLEGPAVWNGVVDVGHRRKRVRRNILNVLGIGI